MEVLTSMRWKNSEIGSLTGFSHRPAIPHDRGRVEVQGRAESLAKVFVCGNEICGKPQQGHIEGLSRDMDSHLFL